MKTITSEVLKHIDLSDVDYTGTYRMYNLFHQFEMLATINGEVVGLWDPSMKEKYAWVLSKQSLHLNRPILKDEIITVMTIADNGTHVSFPRNYFIYKDNEELGHCASMWTLIDRQNRRIVAPKRIGLNPPVFTHDKKLPAPKTIDIDVDMNCIMSKQVLYSDVDINLHMNNRKYIEWSLDLVDFNLFKDHYISDISIQYQKEIMPLQHVSLYLGQDDNRYIVQGKDEEYTYFTIEFIFTKK